MKLSRHDLLTKRHNSNADSESDILIDRRSRLAFRFVFFCTCNRCAVLCSAVYGIGVWCADQGCARLIFSG